MPGLLLDDDIYIGVSLGGFAVVIFVIYWTFFIPINWTRELTDVGYNFIKAKHKSKSARKEAINQLRQLRKIGDQMLPPFPNGWIPITESRDLKPGQAIEVTCLDEHFVVFRTETNDVHVLDAYCPHMGANLGIGGTVYGDCIECPFHQWRFRGSDGQCTNIPYSTSGTVPKNAKVKNWISKEVDGSIFVWYHAENEVPWDLPITKEIESNEYVYHGRNEFSVNCHIQEIPENGADLAHFTAVHGDSLFAGGDPKFKWRAAIGTHAWEATWQPNPEIKHFSNITLLHYMRFFGKLKICSINVCGQQVGPAFVRLHMKSIFGPCTVVQTVTPVEPLVQKVIHRFYAPRYAAPFMKFLIFGESVMFERDTFMWNHKMFVNSPCLVKEDRNIKVFRNWYSQFYSENSKPFSQAKKSLEW